MSGHVIPQDNKINYISQTKQHYYESDFIVSNVSCTLLHDSNVRGGSNHCIRKPSSKNGSETGFYSTLAVQ